MNPNTPKLTRRRAGALIASLAAGLLRAGAAASPAPSDRWGPPRPFSWDILVERARRLAARPYAPPRPSASAAASWDDFVRLSYGTADAMTGTVRLFPTRRDVAPFAVAMHLVSDGVARALRDTRGLFGADGAADPSGWRVLDPNGMTDWMAFLGASYFRCSGTANRYGLSTRGVAVDTGLPGTEEFPAFTGFWIEQRGADRVLAHALLDGPSLSGAYAIDTVRQADGTNVQDVRCALFPRRDIARLGIAPQTSMFLYDQTRASGLPDAPTLGDWRPEVHDSDGLAIWTGAGERIWRPLHNPDKARMHAFRADHPRGFGLMQRDRHFSHYEDDSLFYDLRPSLWMEPHGDWGTGSVMLYEMASISETVDNIGAFWVADRPVRAGQRRDYAYRLTWTTADPSTDASAHCTNVFVGPLNPDGLPADASARKYVIDFAGASLAAPRGCDGVRAVTDLPPGAVIALGAHAIERQPGSCRVVLDLRLTGLTRKEFRVFLQRGADALSETVILTLEP
jgi:glucans biosynthesis protein